MPVTNAPTSPGAGVASSEPLHHTVVIFPPLWGRPAPWGDARPCSLGGWEREGGEGEGGSGSGVDKRWAVELDWSLRTDTAQATAAGATLGSGATLRAAGVTAGARRLA